jgi:gamma-glutamyl-gamma-aminobutyrate hydrolase PuuD
MLNPHWHLIKAEVARQHAGPYVEKNVIGYTIAIICRGEQLLYTDMNGSLIVEISIPGKWIDAASIRKWDETRRVSEEQRSMVVDRIKEYFSKSQRIGVDVINGNKYSGVRN